MLYQNKYRVKSLRLVNWNYSNVGWYFITICTKGKKCYFGSIIDGNTILNKLGKMSEHYLLESPYHFSNIDIDEFVIMPNHIHIIINIKEICRGVACNTSTNRMSIISPKPGSLSTIIRSYKSVVTKWARQNDYHNFTWQSSFYDHIIRNERSLFRIRKYIKLNPVKWSLDKENPLNN